MWSEVSAGRQAPYLPFYLPASSTPSTAATARYSGIVFFVFLFFFNFFHWGHFYSYRKRAGKDCSIQHTVKGQCHIDKYSFPNQTRPEFIDKTFISKSNVPHNVHTLFFIQKTLMFFTLYDLTRLYGSFQLAA